MSRYFKALAAVILTASCATPIAPTGGPADTTGPDVVFTNPETGTVNFTGDSFEFGFSEFVNRANFAKALTIEPDMGPVYDIKWKRKKAVIRFREALPDSTTIILTLGTEVTDTRSNKIGAPIKLAVSTGSEIDSGEITGRINDAVSGKAKAGQKVLLYRYPADFTETAVYAAETDTSGVFNFKYLREGRYQAIMLDDRNRNKIWDAGRETARPFHKEWFELERGGTDTLSTVYWFEADTLKPELQAVGLLTSQKLRLRFSKEIKFTDAVNIQITDTLKNPVSEVIPLNISEKDPFIAFGFSEESLHPDSSYSITLQGITDFAGNEALTTPDFFKGNAREDTTRQRILAVNGRTGLNPDEAFVAQYAAPIEEPDIIDSVLVVEGETSFDDWPGITFEKNKVIVPPKDRWTEGTDYQFLMWEPADQKRNLFKTEVRNPVDFGGIEVSLDSLKDSTRVFRLEIQSKDETVRLDTVFSQSFHFDNIPPIEYHVKVFEDANGNGVWDYGSVSPYAAPEFYFYRQNIKVQKGFTTEIPVKLD